MKKITNPYMVSGLSRELAALSLTTYDQIGKHIQRFANAKHKLACCVGDNLLMAETDWRVPICLLKHKNSSIDLQKVFLEHGVLAVPGCEFDSLNKSFVRIRMPKEEELSILLKAVRDINNSYNIGYKQTNHALV
jgi:histidinol-phosphate aminotransferase